MKSELLYRSIFFTKWLGPIPELSLLFKLIKHKEFWLLSEQLKIEIQILSLHWMLRDISYFNVCGAKGSHRLDNYLNLEGFLEKPLKIISALKNTGKSLKSLEKSLNSTIFCMT